MPILPSPDGHRIGDSPDVDLSDANAREASFGRVISLMGGEFHSRKNWDHESRS